MPLVSYESGLAVLNCGIPQGPVLGPLLFLLHISDLNQAIKFCKVHHFADDTNLLYFSNSICKVHHFADDTNLLYFSNSIKKLNKLVNADLKYLANWLNANRILLKVKKNLKW